MAESEPKTGQDPEETPREREFQSIRERDEPLTEGKAGSHGDEDVVEQEAEAAAAEAGAVGGRTRDEELDEAERPAAEHGGGESEGFEQAERDLIEAAQHGDEPDDPANDEHEVAVEALKETAAHGDPDRVRSTERRGEE